MKRFFELITESLTFLYKYKGIKVYNTEHSVQRRIERVKDLTKKDFEVIFQRMIKKILEDKTYFDLSRHYLFYSLSYHRGIVIDYEYPRIRIITILPKDKWTPKKGTIGVFVEHVHENQIISKHPEILEFLISILPEEKLAILNENFTFQRVTYEGIDFYFVEGKLYDTDVDVVPIE